MIDNLGGSTLMSESVTTAERFLMASPLFEESFDLEQVLQQRDS
jgi:hypothetical protein